MILVTIKVDQNVIQILIHPILIYIVNVDSNENYTWEFALLKLNLVPTDPAIRIQIEALTPTKKNKYSQSRVACLPRFILPQLHLL